MGTASCLYAGEVIHQRHHPKRHRFAYRINAFLFDLGELSALGGRCRWFSVNRFNLFSFYWRDFGFGNGQTPRSYVESLLRSHHINEAPTRISLLCYPRILGYAFNPLAVYFCYRSSGSLFALIYEVSNTFGERHRYVLPVDEEQQDARKIRQQADKAFYVSPFMGMDQRYAFDVQPPGEAIAISIRQSEQSREIFFAGFQGERRPFNDAALLKTFFSLPLMTLKVTAAIHWEALKLWLKGLPLQSRKPSGFNGSSGKSSYNHFQ